MVSAVLSSVFWRLSKLRLHVNVFQEIKQSTKPQEFLGVGSFHYGHGGRSNKDKELRFAPRPKHATTEWEVGI